MEILQLKYFCDAALTENFSKTAKNFNVPSSNISQCIKRLENELSTQLFVRQANKIKLNEQGQAFYDSVSKALTILDEARKELLDNQKNETIRICIFTNRRIIMAVIEKFRHRFPEIMIEISHGTINDNNDYDIIISDEEFKNSKLEKKLIISEEISLAVKKDNPLAFKSMVTANDLAAQEFISMNKESSMYRITKKISNELGFEPNIVIRSEDPFYVRKCVELGLGITIFPELSWRGQFSDDIIIKSIGNFKRNTYAYWHNKSYKKQTVKEFLTVLITECENTHKKRNTDSK